MRVSWDNRSIQKNINIVKEEERKPLQKSMSYRIIYQCTLTINVTEIETLFFEKFWNA